MVDHRGFTVIPQDGDIRAMHGPAHIQTTGHGYAQLCRESHVRELVKENVHGGLYCT